MAKLIQMGHESKKMGIVYEKKGMFDEAIKAYKAAAESYLRGAMFLEDPTWIESYKKQAKEILDHMDKITEARAKGQLRPSEPTIPPIKANDGGGAKPVANAKNNDQFNSAISSAIVRMKPNVKWDDVVGLDKAKEALKEAVILPMMFPQLFQGKREPWRGILLYGCPGTGKSFLAKAVATECDATFFSVSSSDLVSKYVGESARLIRALFEMARAEKQAVVFIDEVDSLVSARSGEESDASRQIKTEFLVQMQGVGNAGGNVLVLGATNYPEALDSAIRRRFEKRIEIVLPDALARTHIIRSNIETTNHSLTDDDFHTLGKETEGYSGSDLSNMCKEALMIPIRELQRAEHFAKADDNHYYPCSATAKNAEKLSLTDFTSNGKQLGVPPVTMVHMKLALKNTKSSVSKADIERIQKFSEEFGERCHHASAE